MVFDRFDEAAREAMLRAQAWARWLRHHEIGTEHLLLALVQDGEAVAGRALSRLGVTPEAAGPHRRGQTSRRSAPRPHPDGRFHEAGHPAGAERELEARRRLGPEHLLLGLIKERRGVGALVLRQMDVDHRRARPAVVEVLEGAAGA